MDEAARGGAELRVLILTPTAKDGAVTARLLGRAGIAHHLCADLAELCGEVGAGAGALLLPEERLARGGAALLAALLARQPAWSDLPVLLLTYAAQDTPALDGLVETLGNVTLLQRPVRTITLLSSIRAALRSRGRQYEIREHLSEREKTAEGLRRAVEAADQASKAKSEFLARMSHEIRTPMNGIMGMTELALMEEGLPERAREFLGLAKHSARGLLDIINDVLDLARIEAGRIELDESPFELAASLHDLLAPLRHLAERKGLQLFSRVAPNVPTALVGDQGRLRQVLTNLIGNAIKFTDRGEVEIVVESAGEPVVPGRRKLLFSVRDTGIGIPKASLRTIFDSFSQATRSTHAKFGGTGLGLSIARQLVELMGGRIWAESEPGQGSLFRFTAEFVVAERREARPPATRSPEPAPRERLRVLVAEDNPLNRVFAKELLARLGHEVVLACDGEEALRTLSRERFDVVLMDVQMPGVDGDEVTRRVRAGLVEGCPPDVSVIALTAHAVGGDRERFLATGMDDYLPKPFDRDALEDVLRRVAARRREKVGSRGARRERDRD